MEVLIVAAIGLITALLGTVVSYRAQTRLQASRQVTSEITDDAEAYLAKLKAEDEEASRAKLEAEEAEEYLTELIPEELAGRRGGSRSSLQLDIERSRRGLSYYKPRERGTVKLTATDYREIDGIIGKHISQGLARAREEARRDLIVSLIFSFVFNLIFFGLGSAVTWWIANHPPN